MQILLYLILVAGCSYIGYGIGNFYVKRYNFLMNLILFANHLKTEINFSHNTLENIVNKHIDNFSVEFKKVLKNYLIVLEESDYVTMSDLTNNLNNIYLEPSEQNEMLQFFSILGTSDASSQIKVIDKFINSFNLFLNEAKIQKEKYGILYKKLGVLVGILLVIIML